MELKENLMERKGKDEDTDDNEDDEIEDGDDEDDDDDDNDEETAKGRRLNPNWLSLAEFKDPLKKNHPRIFTFKESTKELYCNVCIENSVEKGL
jgi:hypothetical protein